MTARAVAGATTDGPPETRTVAELYLELLASRGVDYFFGNAGTDFAPLIEAFAKAAALGRTVPRPITAPHENVAVALAMGVTMVTGRPQAVMLHTNVGLANGLCQLLNASRLNLPMLLTSGRTPVSEDDIPGSRTIDIHWTQEMYDQTGMVREAVKWDYELRHPGQIRTVVDRALAIARTAPPGPVYLMLPREVLAADLPRGATAAGPAPPGVHDPFPDPGAVEQLAAWLRAAEFPLIVTTTLGRDPEAVGRLAEFAARFAVPVAQTRPRYMNLASAHPMHLGYDPGDLVQRADLVLVMDCEVPWIPKRHALRPDCKVAHVGADPLHSAIPIRGFPSHLAISAVPRAVLPALTDALSAQAAEDDASVHRRRQVLADLKENRRHARHRALESARARVPVDPRWLSHCLDQAAGGQSIVMREAPLDLDHFDRSEPRTLFGGASGLGWGLGGAIGAKLAAPERRVIATVGDGAYMYGNPVSAHLVSAALGLPFLTVIFNNQSWHAVRRATRGMYPDGYAARSDDEPLTDLRPSPDFEKVVLASGGYGERVEDPAEVPAALERGLRAVESEGRQAVLNVICGVG